MTDIYVGLGVAAFALMVFALALGRAAACGDKDSERLLAEYLRERSRVFEALANATIEARRAQAGEVATRLSHRRTWRQPSSA
jgi:hypothetical protein